MNMFAQDAPTLFGGPMTTPPIVPDQRPQVAKPQAGMFGGGKFGLKQAIAFGLAGFLSRRNPMLLQGLMGAMMQKQQAQADEENYQSHRTDALTDYEAKQKIDAQYPSAPSPTEYERALVASGVQPGSPEWIQHMGNFVNMRENPPFTYVDPATGAVMMGARTQQPQQAPAGVTFTPIDGGPGQTAPGGFPGRPF